MGWSFSVAVFLAAAFGDLGTYVMTSVQLALAFPSEIGGFSASFTKFAGIFAFTQIPLAISEGLLTVLVMNFLKKYNLSELKALRVLSKEAMKMMKKNVLIILAVIILAILPLFIQKGAEFGGADGEAEEAIGEINSSYKPWFIVFGSHQVVK